MTKIPLKGPKTFGTTVAVAVALQQLQKEWIIDRY